METLERNNGSLEKEVAMDMILRQLQELNNRFDGMTSESDNTFQLLSPIPYVPIQVRGVEQEACQFKEQSSPLLGNESSILNKVDHSLIVSNEASELSEDDIDEELVVESPYMLENENVTHIDSSGSDLDKLVTCNVLTENDMLGHDVPSSTENDDNATNLGELEKGVCQVLLEPKGTIEDKTNVDSIRKIEANNEAIPKQLKGIRLFKPKTRRRKHRLKRTKQKPLHIMPTIQETNEEELSMKFVGNSLEHTDSHTFSFSCADLNDEISLEHKLSLGASDMDDGVASNHESFPCSNNIDRDVLEHVVAETDFLEHDMIKSELLEADSVSFSSFLFPLDRCEDDVCSISCLSTDSYLPISHAFYFHFSCSCTDLISSFTSYNGLEKGLFDDFAGLYEETNTVQQVGIDGALQMESPIVKTEDNQANFIIKDENSRSAPCEQKGHFLDSFSIKCSTAYYDSTKSVHKRDITIIEDALIIESPIHVQNSDLLEHSKTSFENFIFLPYDIIHIQRSFHLILSCDFPPDIGRLCSIEYDSFKFALESRVENNHDLILSHKHSHVFIHEILSCDIPLDLNIHEKDHLTCMVFIDCISANCGSSLKVLNLHSSLQHQTATYTLEPLPVDLEPPPKKSYQREWTIVKKFQILIRDENFCYKSLKRFHYTVVPFLPLLT